MILQDERISAPTLQTLTPACSPRQVCSQLPSPEATGFWEPQTSGPCPLSTELKSKEPAWEQDEGGLGVHLDIGWGKPSFGGSPYHSLATCPWASHLTPPHSYSQPQFPPCEMGIVTVLS